MIELKVVVLNVFGEDGDNDVFVFDKYHKAVDKIKVCIKDYCHFDTDTPYLTEDELKEVIEEMEAEAYDSGVYEYNEELRFTIDECYVD